MIPVVNRRESSPHPGDIYVGRPSRWGNPYRLAEPESLDERLQVIESFRDYLLRRPWMIDELRALKPRRLVCWCAPLPCHADVLAELMEIVDG